MTTILSQSAFGASAQAPVSKDDVLPFDGTGKTILVDYNGTLSLTNAAGSPEPNLALIYFLTMAKLLNYKVVIHSGNPSDNENLAIPMMMRKNAMFALFIEEQINYVDRELCDGTSLVESKGVTDSSQAYLTIDDEHGGAYSSHAPRQWGPIDQRMAATLKAWSDVPREWQLQDGRLYNILKGVQKNLQELTDKSGTPSLVPSIPAMPA